MATKDIAYFEEFKDFCKALREAGAFLVVTDEQGKPNVMTIGWAAIGPVWSEPVLMVLVRPSRYTFGLIDKAKRFSVNVPIRGLRGELEFCGSHSGRNVDKVKECGLHVLPGREPGVKILADCDLFYECEIVQKTKVLKETLDARIIGKYYPAGDFHGIFFGRILSCYRAPR